MIELREELSKAFKKISSNLNPSSFNYLGMHVERDRSRRTMALSQLKYIEAIVGRLQLGEEDALDVPHDDSLLEIDVNSDPLPDD